MAHACVVAPVRHDGSLVQVFEQPVASPKNRPFGPAHAGRPAGQRDGWCRSRSPRCLPSCRCRRWRPCRRWACPCSSRPARSGRSASSRRPRPRSPSSHCSIADDLAVAAGGDAAARPARGTRSRARRSCSPPSSRRRRSCSCRRRPRWRRGCRRRRRPPSCRRWASPCSSSPRGSGRSRCSRRRASCCRRRTARRGPRRRCHTCVVLTVMPSIIGRAGVDAGDGSAGAGVAAVHGRSVGLLTPAQPPATFASSAAATRERTCPLRIGGLLARLG